MSCLIRSKGRPPGFLECDVENCVVQAMQIPEEPLIIDPDFRDCEEDKTPRRS